MGIYDEMSTARLTWLVLDRLVPTDEEAYARAALIARDPGLQSLVSQGILTDDQAIEALRAEQTRYGEAEGFIGDRAVLLAKGLATFLGGTFFAWMLLHLAR